MLTRLLAIPLIKAFLQTLDKITFGDLEKSSIMQWSCKLKRRLSRIRPTAYVNQPAVELVGAFKELLAPLVLGNKAFTSQS